MFETALPIGRIDSASGWRAAAPAGAPCSGPRRELDSCLRFYNFDLIHHGQLTAGQIPADIVDGARKMDVR